MTSTKDRHDIDLIRCSDLSFLLYTCFEIKSPSGTDIRSITGYQVKMKNYENMPGTDIACPRNTRFLEDALHRRYFGVWEGCPARRAVLGRNI